MQKGWKKCHECGKEITFNTDQQEYVAYSVFIINEGKLTNFCQSCIQSTYTVIVEDYESEDHCAVVRRVK